MMYVRLNACGIMDLVRFDLVINVYKLFVMCIQVLCTGRCITPRSLQKLQRREPNSSEVTPTQTVAVPTALRSIVSAESGDMGGFSTAALVSKGSACSSKAGVGGIADNLC